MKRDGFVFRKLGNESGFVLVLALVLMVVLVIIGISATNTTVFELQTAGNDRSGKSTFYAAEGGLEVGTELIEQSIWDFPGTTLTQTGTDLDGVALYGSDSLYVRGDYSLLPTSDYFAPADIVLDEPDAFFSYEFIAASDANNSGGSDYRSITPRTELWYGGVPVHASGGALQQLAGYEGAGKGRAGGGGGTLYDIHSISHGLNNSRTHLLIQWMHTF